MYICVCNAVAERNVVAEIRAGSTTLEALSARLGLGSGCGACLECARRMLDADTGRGGVGQAGDTELLLR